MPRKLERRERMVPDVIRPNEIRTRLVSPTLRRCASVEKKEEKLTRLDVPRTRKNGDPCCLEIVRSGLYQEASYRVFTPMNISDDEREIPKNKENIS